MTDGLQNPVNKIYLLIYKNDYRNQRDKEDQKFKEDE